MRRHLALLLVGSLLAACGSSQQNVDSPEAKAPPSKESRPAPPPETAKSVTQLDPEKRFPDKWWLDKRFRCPRGGMLQGSVDGGYGRYFCGSAGAEEGPYVVLADNHPQEEGWFSAGNLQGLQRSWQFAGSFYLGSERHYKDGVQDGVSREYFDNGKEKLVANYVDGKLDGEVVRYSSDGKELGRFALKAGSGPWADYYDNGAKQSEGTLKNGVRDGSWKDWDESGAVKQAVVYREGAVAEQTEFAQGKPARVRKYRANGTEESVTDVDAAGKPHGPATTYHENGTRASQGQYRQGKKDGRWTVFAESGDVAATETYRGDKRVNRKKGGKPPEPYAAHGGGGGFPTGIEACDRYLRRLSSCDKMPPEAREGLKQSFEAWKQAREQVRKAGADVERQWIEQMSKTCEQASQGWEATLKAQGC